MTSPRSELGRQAEDAVAAELTRLGWRILGRNIRVGMLEIDLIARQGPVVAVVEVRTRGAGSWQGPFESLGPAKCARVRRAGETLWRTRFRADPSLERMRFDVASVSFSVDAAPTIEYVRAAF